MNREEAVALLAKETAFFRQKPYSDLVPLIGNPGGCEVTGSSGAAYQIEVNGTWDDKNQKHLRISGSIDDGGLRAWINTKPYLEDFIMRPDGTFAGE
jgi:hypothetical protein